MALLEGQVVNNRYRIDSLMGQGGFGAVYKAWDMKLNGPCALKENLDTSPEAEKQFAREASILFNLRHPNLPTVFDYFSIPKEGLYLVMSYVEGEDLQQILEKRQEPLPEKNILPWIRQVCEALSYLHQQDPPIIHRDIKPANIRITPQGQAILVDFGIAKIYDPKLKTTVGARAVTPGYSPPEQYGRGSTDERTDIYALGATLFTLLTGVEPPDSVDLLTGEEEQILGAKVHNPQITPTVDTAIQQAMQLDREKRYQSVDDLKTALLAVSPTIRAEVSPPERISYETKVLTETEKAVPIQQGKRRRFRPWQWILLAVVFAVVLGILAIVIEPSRDWLVEVYEDIRREEVSDFIPPEDESSFPSDQIPEDRQPEIQRYPVPTNNDPPLGDPDAAVRVIEFGDFRCRECQIFQFDYLPQIRHDYGPQVNFFFLDFPQEQVHPGTFSAALAANCAMEQGRYWPYLERLFTADQELGLPGYYLYAENLDMNVEAFSICFEEKWYFEEVNQDIEIGEQLGVRDLPTFFINGIRIDGLVPYDEFVDIIERELGWR